MGNAVVNRVLDFFRGDNADTEEIEDGDYYEFENAEEPEEESEKGFFGKKGSKVVNMPQTQVRMKICKPTSFNRKYSKSYNLLDSES